MAQLNTFICKQCGWSVEAPPDNGNVYMEGIVAALICLDCRHVFKHYHSFDEPDDDREVCPKCGSHHINTCEQGSVCPQCGGELEDKGLFCLID